MVQYNHVFIYILYKCVLLLLLLCYEYYAILFLFIDIIIFRKRCLLTKSHTTNWLIILSLFLFLFIIYR